VFGLAYGKECTNVPTERLSHTIRSQGVLERGGVFNEEAPADEIGRISGILASPRTALINVFRKFLTWNGGDEVRDFLPVVEEELTDDVLVDFDDWGQAWRTIAKPMVDKTARRGEMYGGSLDQNDVLTVQLQGADEIGDKDVESREEVVSRSEPAVAGLLKDASLHKVK